MSPIENDPMVEQIPTAVADPTFRYTVLPRAANRNSNRAHAQTLCGLQNLPLERVLAVKDERLRCGIVGEGQAVR
jgi:hypothetical protein